MRVGVLGVGYRHFDDIDFWVLVLGHFLCNILSFFTFFTKIVEIYC